MEDFVKCKYFDVTCSEADVLRKHIKRSIETNVINAKYNLKIKKQRIYICGIIIQYNAENYP